MDRAREESDADEEQAGQQNFRHTVADRCFNHRWPLDRLLGIGIRSTQILDASVVRGSFRFDADEPPAISGSNCSKIPKLSFVWQLLDPSGSGDVPRTFILINPS